MSLFDNLWHFDRWNNGNSIRLHSEPVTAILAKDCDAVEKTIAKGTKVRIVMVSRFGDVGITDDIASVNYCARVGNPRNPGELETWFTNIEGL